MESSSMRSGAAFPEWARDIDWGAVATWLLGFGLVAYLGVEGGGYDQLVHGQVGIAIWWLLLAGVLVGALPRRRPTALAWVALGLLVAFVAWTALSIGWSESVERTFVDLARVAGYLGAFALAVFLRGRDSARHLVSGVAAGIVVVAIVALLSRLHPSWFPAADQTARLLGGNEERLAYPLHYWNALAALVAIGLPLLLWLASDAKSVAARALAAAALPALALTAFLTLSRGGIGAAVLAVLAYLALSADRLPKLATLLIASAGGAILCLAVDSRDSLQDALRNATAESQGDEMLVITVLVCAAVGTIQALVSVALPERRPAWLLVSRERSLFLAAGAAVVALVLLAALDVPGRASEAWDEFKDSDSPGEGSGRLISAAGQNRYAYWEAALDQNASEPLTGTGSGTFEFWWTRNRDSGDAVRDTHSLYMQTLGELGIVGFLLLLAFLLAVLLGGGYVALRSDAARRSLLAAALAGCLAFCLTAAVDWMWQMPVLAVCLLLLGGVLVAARVWDEGEDEDRGAFPLPLRLAFGALALVAIVAIAIPLSSASLVRESEADARDGDLTVALEAARSAQNVEPSAATPRLQQALLLEELGELGPAAEAARAATEREETNWRTWLVLSRIEAQRGRAAAAVAAYRRARSLNPYSPLFEQ
jgi:hypothetical protein